MRVVIIGAGLGGLTLLHGLRAAGIDARVFERSPRDGVQPASYGIHLNADGLAAMHACLPAANWAMIDAAGVPSPNVIRFRDPRTGILSTVDKRFPEHATDPVTKRRAISRGKLREALLFGTAVEVDDEPLVHWGKKFLGYDQIGDRVRVRFEDGTTVEADLLVGADGSNSRVRQQRLPEVRREDLGILNVAGRIPLSRELQTILPPDMIDGSINNVVPAGSGWMFLSTWNTGDPDTTDVSDGATQYIIWAWAGARDSYPEDIGDYDGPALRQLIQDRMAGWDPSLRTMVRVTDPSTISTVPLRSMPQLPLWATSNVTLLGDAIHNMTPMAGIGANTALRDANQLRRALTTGSGSAEARIAAYETVMRTYANEALALSTRNSRNAALASKGNRTAFRTLLRLGRIIPPLKARMFGPTVD